MREWRIPRVTFIQTRPMSDDRPKVVMTQSLRPEAEDWLAERAEVVLCNDAEEPDRFAQELADADGLIVRTYTQVNEQLLAMAPKLRVIGRPGVGLDNFDLDACRRRSVRVVYTPAANTQAVVEWCWGLILDALRPRHYLRRRIDPAEYHRIRKQTMAPQLDQMTLGVLGMGRIGRRMADVGHAIGVRVLYNDLLDPRQLELAEDDPTIAVDKPTLWQEADVLTIHVDGRPENHHLIDADVLAQLKPTCLIVNAARGGLIDPEALAAWAHRVKEQGGMAALDVQEPEPPPADWPLWELENVHVTPHLAARTPVALSNMAWVVRDVIAVLRGEKPTHAAV